MAWASVVSDDSSFSTTIMAANLPTLVKRGVVAGDPDNGLLPSGQVAAVIDKLEDCGELIETIAGDAEARLQSLAGHARNG